MSANPGDLERPRVGLRAVAQAAGVSLMTASLAVRDSPRLLAKTREHVRAVAEKIGYRPDPEISRLMNRLRPSRTTQGGIVLGMIDLHRRAQPEVHSYDAGVRQGIITRARKLGYGASVFPLSDYGGSLSRLMRVIRSRGITGVILLPSTQPVELDPAISWDGISVVAATSTVIAPQFHQVTPNHLHNIRMILDLLRERGLRRPLAIFNESLDRRTHNLYSIVLAWSGHAERIQVLRDDMSDSAAAAEVESALERHNPDVILGGDAMMRVLKHPGVARRCAKRQIITLTSRSTANMPYLDQRPDLVGECAVSLLTGMMHNHETGVPASPQVTLIRGGIREPARETDRPRPKSSERARARAAV